MKIKIGSTRIVFVFENVVVKVPIFLSWRRFIAGVASNYKEYEIWSNQAQNPFGRSSLLCPIEDNLMGLILIASRAETLSQDEFDGIKSRLIEQFEGLIDPQEMIRTNVGKIKENEVNRYVLIDYGINLRRTKELAIFRLLRILRKEMRME